MQLDCSQLVRLQLLLPLLTGRAAGLATVGLTSGPAPRLPSIPLSNRAHILLKGSCADRGLTGGAGVGMRILVRLRLVRRGAAQGLVGGVGVGVLHKQRFLCILLPGLRLFRRRRRPSFFIFHTLSASGPILRGQTSGLATPGLTTGPTLLLPQS